MLKGPGQWGHNASYTDTLNWDVQGSNFLMTSRQRLKIGILEVGVGFCRFVKVEVIPYFYHSPIAANIGPRKEKDCEQDFKKELRKPYKMIIT